MRKAFSVLYLAILVSCSNVAIASEEGPTPEDIKFVQGLLLRLGYDPGPLDGVCGDRTVEAVRSFHEAHDLPLKPGHIEPQAATVVKNLTSAFADYVMRPQSSAPEEYRLALEGDPDAALGVGAMYNNGASGPGDPMMAYAWYSVAELSGNVDAGRLKRLLASTGNVTEHEMRYAMALAAKIDVSADRGGIEPSNKVDQSRTEPTM